MTYAKCNICQKLFKKKSDLISHNNRYKQECKNYKFKCLKCDYLTNKKSYYEKHILTNKHIELNNICVICLKAFDKPSMLERHKNRKVKCKKIDSNQAIEEEVKDKAKTVAVNINIDNNDFIIKPRRYSI